MMKIVIFGLLAVGAMAQFPGLMGGLGGLPDGAMDMLKNLKADDIKKLVKDMPPQMMEMMKGMGITEEQLKDTVDNMPADFDISSVMGGMKGGQDQMKEESIAGFKKEMENMGIDLSNGMSGLQGQILPKMTEMLGNGLRNFGVDTDNTEKIRSDVHLELRMMIGAGKDATNEEVKEKLMKKLTEEMKEDGIEFDEEKLVDGFKQQMKEMGMDVEDGMDAASLKDMMMVAMKSGKFGNPQDMVQQFVPPQFGAPQFGAPQFAATPMDLNMEININL